MAVTPRSPSGPANIVAARARTAAGSRWRFSASARSSIVGGSVGTAQDRRRQRRSVSETPIGTLCRAHDPASGGRTMTEDSHHESGEKPPEGRDHDGPPEGPGQDGPPHRPESVGWSGRVAVKSATDGFAYVPGEVLTTDPGRALDLARDLFPGAKVTVDKEPIVGRFSRLRGVPDVIALVQHLQDFGLTAQPNLVFFAHCDDPCCGRPHPAVRCQGGGGPSASPVYASPVYASPVYASPVYASPVYASPVYASPVYASPVYASPVYASPVYASPVYASPVYASEYVATGHRHSSAVPVSPADAADVAARLAAASTGGAGGAPDVVVLDTGLARNPDFWPMALVPLAAIVAPGGDPGDGQDVPDADPVDDQLDPAAGHGTFIAGLVERVAPGARVEVHRVLHPQGDGDEACIARLIDKLPPRTAA